MHSRGKSRLLESIIRPEIQAIQAYHVPPARDMVKLDAMENPYAWPGSLREKWLDRLQTAEVNRYPDPGATALCGQLRQFMGIPETYELVLGNGSDELIQMLALAVTRERPLLALEPSFVMYRMIAGFAGLPYLGVPLLPTFSIDLPAVLKAMDTHDPGLIFIAQPNNPTGNAFAEQDLREIIEACRGLVVIDEAYTPFTDRDSLSLLADYDHVLLMRTVSKMGLAGLRLGLLVGRPDWIETINKIRLPYNINVLTQISATFALEQGESLLHQAGLIRAERAWMQARLAEIPGLQVFPSEANFILVKTPGGCAGRIHLGLQQSGVLIKCLDGAHPLLADCLRITVGLRQENTAVLTGLERLLGEALA